jgi:hypothetical protein
MDPKDFKPTKNGDLVKVGQGAPAYWAFIPKPLPPRLKYSPELAKLASEAALAVGSLKGGGVRIERRENYAGARIG